MIRINLDKMPLTLVTPAACSYLPEDTRPLAAAGTVQVHVKLLICDMFIISWNLISFNPVFQGLFQCMLHEHVRYVYCIQKKYFT